jgi:hypothetical protein
MESKSRTESGGKIKHAETLGGEYIFQATFAYAESVRGLLREFTAVLGETANWACSLHTTFRRRALDQLSNRTAV